MSELQSLREIASGLGIKVHHKHSEETLKKLIAGQQAHRVEDVMKHRAEVNLETAVLNTQDEVLSVIEPYAKKEGFVVKFYDDNTWYFHYKGAEDSGHMSTPLRSIRMKAEMVSHGRRSPRALETSKSGNYAETVLA